MIGTLLMALLLAAQPAREPITLTPAQFAAALQGMVGQRFEGGVTIARVFAEDRTLVIVLDGPAHWRDAMTAEQVSALFTGSFCEDSDFDYFVEGNAMRVDTTVAGTAGRPGPLIRTCAPAPGTQ
jgi:hypothetical protein